MFKKIHFLAVIFLTVVMSICSISYVNAGEGGSEKFILGFDADFPPYGYKDDNGEYVGFDLSLAEEVCKRNGWELIKQPVDWDSKDMELNTGTIDCIWNGFTMNGREGDYTWSSPYIDNSQVVVVKSSSGIESLDELKGKVVVVQTDSSALAAFTGENAEKENVELCKEFKELQQVSDYNNAFMNLESGAVDAICMDIGVAKYQLESRGSSFKMLDEYIATEQYAIGFKKGNTELRDEVQDTLIEMVKDGTFQKISEEWELADYVCLDENSSVDDEKYNDTNEKDNIFVRLGKVMQQLAPGMAATFSIFVFTLLFSLPLGLLVAFLRMSKISPVRWIAKIYISIMRGTPLMLQLLVVFFGPHYVLHMSVSNSYRFYAVIIGFALNYAAYFAEIYRAGIEAVPVGQREAAAVLGYSKTQIFGKIVFPQMVKRVLPPVTNEIITLVKDTSLAFVLAYTEMFTIAKQVAAADTSIMPLFAAGVFYYVFNFLVAFIMESLEKKLSYYS